MANGEENLSCKQAGRLYDIIFGELGECITAAELMSFVNKLPDQTIRKIEENGDPVAIISQAVIVAGANLPVAAESLNTLRYPLDGQAASTFTTSFTPWEL